MRRLLALGMLLTLATLVGPAAAETPPLAEPAAAETLPPVGTDARTPADLGLRAYKAIRVAQRPLKIHGPFVLTARELAALRRIDGPHGPGEDEDEDGRPCRTKDICGGPKVGDAGRTTPTPAPNVVVDSRLTASDPQIAAGANFLVSTGYQQIGFFDKAGLPLTTTKNGQPLNLPLTTLAFFGKLTNDINTNLNLPLPIYGATVANGFGIDTYYDTRAIYDSYRKRFWITSLAINNKAAGQADPVLRGARRGKLAVAVSSTDDPRDAWLLYWWDDNRDDAGCNKPLPCINEHGSDYPSIGISNLYFTTENAAGDNTAQTYYRWVTVTSADDLAKGTCAQNCKDGWSFYGFTNADGSSNTGNLIQPAVQHGKEFPAAAFFASSFQGNGKSWLSSWMFLGGQMFLASVPIKSFGSPANAQQAQQPALGVTTPFPLKIANTGNYVMKAAMRGTKLYATLQDCRIWPSSNNCLTSIRVIRVDVKNMVTPEIDRTFGLRNAADPVNVLGVSYGVPAVEVNRNGDIGLVYIRSGATLAPEARFSLYAHGAADISPSQVLKAGTGAVGGNCAALPCKAVGNLDVGGISVDDADDTAFWVAHGYAKGTGWTIAIGKFLGTP